MNTRFLALTSALLTLALSIGAPLHAGTNTINTTEAWRVGADDVVIGSVSGIVRTGDGVTYLLDRQANVIHVVSAEGEYTGDIGREGEGPGEFRNGVDLLLLPGGDLCVLQEMPARAVVIMRDGEAGGELSIPRDEGGGHAFLSGGAAVGDVLVFRLGKFVRTEVKIGLETVFTRVDEKGNAGVTYWSMFQEADLANVTFNEKADASPVWAVGADGRFYVNKNWDDYAVEVISPEGKQLRVLTRDYKPAPRSKPYFDEIDRRKEKGEVPGDIELAQNHRAIERLIARPNGDLWVISGRGLHEAPKGSVVVVDVFNSDGAFVGQTDIKGHFLNGRDDFHIVGDHVFVVANTGELAQHDSIVTANYDDIDSGEIVVICEEFASR